MTRIATPGDASEDLAGQVLAELNSPDRLRELDQAVSRLNHRREILVNDNLARARQAAAYIDAPGDPHPLAMPASMFNFGAAVAATNSLSQLAAAEQLAKLAYELNRIATALEGGAR